MPSQAVSIKLMSYTATSLPIETELPPAVSFLASPIYYYFNAGPPYNNVALEALIFSPPPRPPRILLLQHKGGGTDPNAFSSYWQIPSGKPVFEDQTLVHTLARVIQEQTGLRLSHVAGMLGSQEGPGTWQSGNLQWMKMLFMVEVAELALISMHASKQSPTPALESDHGSVSSDRSMEQGLDLDSVQVRTNPEKSGFHVWATEEDFLEFVNAGLYPVEEVIQYQMILEAFAFYRQDFARVQSLRLNRSSIGDRQCSGL